MELAERNEIAGLLHLAVVSVHLVHRAPTFGNHHKDGHIYDGEAEQGEREDNVRILQRLGELVEARQPTCVRTIVEQAEVLELGVVGTVARACVCGPCALSSKARRRTLQLPRAASGRMRIRSQATHKNTAKRQCSTKARGNTSTIAW
eukprot:2379144-Prymnesium_polylepis.1